MNEQRNLILAIAVSILILIAYQFFVERPRQEKAAEKQRQEQQHDAKTDSGKPAAQKSSAADLLKQLNPAAARAAALKKSARIGIDNPRVTGSIALTGARLDDLSLKDYHESVSKQSPRVKLLLPQGADRPYFALFGWQPPAGNTTKVPSNQTVWSADKKLLSPDSPVTLTWDNGAGLVFTRKIAIDKNYLFTVTQSVRNTTGTPVTLYPYGLISRTGIPGGRKLYVLHEGPIGVFNDTLDEVDYSDLKDGTQERTSNDGWIGFTGKYWLTALAPEAGNKFVGRFRRIDQGEKTEKYQTDFQRDPVTIAPGASSSVTSHLFAGAKEVNLLERYRDQSHIAKLDLAIDFGVLYFLTKPIFKVLAYFYAHIGNFGLSIMLLTFCLRILLFPLANKGYRSMNRMKMLQPKMQELKERFGDDKQRMQQELMALYKSEKVNPAAGCLPIIVQIPIFFSLYKVLLVTIEMRHAPFFGWIHDLSSPDPTTVFNLFGLIPWEPPHFLMIGAWPLAMGVSMFLQQRMNPAPNDPVQAKIFLFMPWFFMFLLANFPAGLVVYWTCNNLLSMAQQWVIKTRMAAADARAKAGSKAST